MQFATGISVGFMFFVAISIATNADPALGRKAHKAKTQCEQTLPRNQRCVITAVPEEIE